MTHIFSFYEICRIKLRILFSILASVDGGYIHDFFYTGLVAAVPLLRFGWANIITKGFDRVDSLQRSPNSSGKVVTAIYG